MKIISPIINLVVGIIIFSSAMVIAGQLIAIPSEMVVAPMTSEVCSSYIYSGKYGWKCPQYGTITTKPLATFVALIINALCIFVLWFRIEALRRVPIQRIYKLLYKFQFGLITLFVLIGRSGQYFLGSARIEFIYWMLPSILLTFYWWHRMTPMKKESGKNQKLFTGN